MAFELLILTEATQDIEEIAEWYADIDENLVERFFAELDSVFAQLINMPSIYPLVFKHYQRALLKKFPYVIYYAVTEQKVVIYGVIHGSRDPLIWQNRLGED